MTTPTPAGAIWPARLAYTDAGIFTAASAGTNLIYGWQKGTDLGGSLVWGPYGGGRRSGAACTLADTASSMLQRTSM